MSHFLNRSVSKLLFFAVVFWEKEFEFFVFVFLFMIYKNNKKKKNIHTVSNLILSTHEPPLYLQPCIPSAFHCVTDGPLYKNSDISSYIILLFKEISLFSQHNIRSNLQTSLSPTTLCQFQLFTSGLIQNSTNLKNVTCQQAYYMYQNKHLR